MTNLKLLFKLQKFKILIKPKKNFYKIFTKKFINYKKRQKIYHKKSKKK